MYEFPWFSKVVFLVGVMGGGGGGGGGQPHPLSRTPMRMIQILPRPRIKFGISLAL
jgi:hypothetical protein